MQKISHWEVKRGCNGRLGVGHGGGGVQGGGGVRCECGGSGQQHSVQLSTADCKGNHIGG